MYKIKIGYNYARLTNAKYVLEKTTPSFIMASINTICIDITILSSQKIYQFGMYRAQYEYTFTFR